MTTTRRTMLQNLRCLDTALLTRLRKNSWEAVTIMDYNVPWDDFNKFDLIIQSREGREYVRYLRDRPGRTSSGTPPLSTSTSPRPEKCRS